MHAYMFPIGRSVAQRIFVMVVLVALACTTGLAQQCTQPPSGLIAWWPLDETQGKRAEDIVGSSHGSYVGTPTPTNGALCFSGSQYLSVPDSNSWAFPGDFTIELRARFSSAGGGSVGHPSHIFIGNDEGPFNRKKWFFALGGGYLNFHVNGPGLGPKFFPYAPFKPNLSQWYHLAVTRTGSTYSVYVDGKLIKSARVPYGIPNPSAPLTIGQAENLGYMRGCLDEVSIYSRALSAQELLAIANAGAAGKCKTLRISPAVGGDDGFATVAIHGEGFATGVKVRLARTGQPDIVGESVSVDKGGATIHTTFDLRGRARGAWDLVITNPNAASRRYATAFLVEAGRAPKLWTQIVGLKLIRPGRTQSFWIHYGNSGNTDVWGAIVWVTVPSTVGWGFKTLMTFPKNPKEAPAPMVALPGHAVLEGKVHIPLFVPRVRAGSRDAVEISITIPNNLAGFQLRASVFPPFGSLLGISSGVPSIRPNKEFLSCLIGLTTEIIGLNALESCAKSFLEQSWAYAEDQFSLADFFYNSVECALGLAGSKVKILKILKEIMEAIGKGKLAATCLKAFLAEDLATLDVVSINSFDPNEKAGPAGSDKARWVSGLTSLSYAILYENLKTATASAQEVVITDRLDKTMFDLSTLSLGPILFGNQRVVPPSGTTRFTRDVKLIPSKLDLRIIANLDPNTGLLTWRFLSIDPATGELTTNPLLGFLPPNNNPPEGEGSVIFHVSPLPQLGTGTAIRNQAEIVFDTNSPIKTQTWTNTLDFDKPSSSVQQLSASQYFSNFMVQWLGTDKGSGIQSYTIWVSEDNGPFTKWLSHTTKNSEVFQGEHGKSYAFYSTATDLAGNHEDPPTAPDTTTKVTAAVVSYGTGLAGTGDVTPVLDTNNQVPKIGNKAFVLRATKLRGGATGFIYVSPKPASIPFLGGTLLIDPSAAVGLAVQADGLSGAAGGGSATLGLKVPNNINLVGRFANCQAGFVDPKAKQGVSMTNGLRVTVVQ